MSSRNVKQLLFAQFAAVSKALSHGHRLELVEILAQGERSVEALSKQAGLSIANTSQHLQRLRRAGLVTSRQSGHFVLYRLADEAVMNLLRALRQLARSQLAEVEGLVATHLRSKDEFESVSREELIRLMRAGEVTVLDVRPREEFDAGHLPEALNIPIGELERRLNELPADQEIAAYCRGPYCVFAFDAVALLRKRGFRARRLEDGLPEWRDAGLPVHQATNA